MKRMSFVLALGALAVVLSLPLAAFATTGTQSAPAQKQQMNPAAAPSAKSAAEMPKTVHAMKKGHWARIDLNSASREELLKLPGVTETTVDKIITGRPYKTVAELETKQVVTKDEFGKLRHQLMVKGAEKKEWKKAEKSEAK